MKYAYNDDQRSLAETARTILAKHLPMSRVREVAETPDGHDPRVWQRLSEAGLLAILAPEHHGGGGTLVDFAAFAEEAGRALLPGPWLETALAVIAVAESENLAAQQRWLPAWSTGLELTTLTGQGASSDPFSGITAARRGNRIAVRGTTPRVPYGHVAESALVAATVDGEPALLVLDLAEGTSSSLIDSVDPRERVADLDVDLVTDSESVLLTGAAARRTRTRLLDIGAALRSVEMTGAARAVIEATVGHACTREQFGRKIGTFQAVQHRLADAATRIENMAAIAYWAVWQMRQPGGRRDAVAVAKAYSSQAYVECCRAAVQMHGGLGFTWEADVHLYLKHARRCASTYGTATEHRQWLADTLLGDDLVDDDHQVDPILTSEAQP